MRKDSIHHCQLCDEHIALTHSGQKWPLTVRGPNNKKYTKLICENCVKLFNTTHWNLTRNKLKELISSWR